MSENTGIRIEAVKEINGNGEQGYRITKIQALADKDLPEAYTKGEKPIAILGNGWTDPENRLFLYDWKKVTYIASWSYVWPRFYTAEDMKKILAHIRAAGQHLADVNAYLAKERETWHGKVTFVDGVEQEQEKDAPSKQPFTEQLYRITDGSWNLCSTNAGMKQIVALAKHTDNKYRIIARDCDLPAYSPAYLKSSKRNDTIVQSVNTGQIVFTCKRFLCQI